MSSPPNRADCWEPQSAALVDSLRHLLGDTLVGVYVHGSAALGDWTPASDLDVLATVDGTDYDWHTVGQEVLLGLDPSPVVELSIVTASDAAAPGPPWPFTVHVDQRGHQVITDNGTGDPDLLMHYVVARDCGITQLGSPAETVFGQVSRPAVLAYLIDELAWAVTDADQKYAVLNACRALAYCREGAVLSKTAGGSWALDNGFDQSLIQSAIEAQGAGTVLGAPGSAARALVADCSAELEEAL